MDETAASATGSDDSLPIGSTQLVLLSKVSLRLMPGEEAQLRLRYETADGEAIGGEHVSFALVGRAQDTSLSNLDVVSDSDGVAENQVMAGEQVAIFQIRVSANGARELYVDVAVSDAGFGTLLVNAEYQGNRKVSQRTVVARANMECDGEPEQPGDPMVTLTDSEPAMFLALPAETAYAVIAVALGPDLVKLASGCVDGVVVRADDEINVQVSFVDEPLSTVGDYVLRAELDTQAPATSLLEVFSAAAETRINTDSSGEIVEATAEARLLLDALERTLSSDEYGSMAGFADAAESLNTERLAPTSTPTLDQSLQAALNALDQGPFQAVLEMARLGELSIASTTLHADLQLDRANGHLPITWVSTRLEAMPIVAGTPPLVVELTADDTTAEAVFLADQDIVKLVQVRFRVPFGSLASQVLRRAVSEPEAGGRGDELREILGCGTFGQWLSQQALMQDACDADCVLSTCNRAINSILSAAEAQLLLLDDSRPTMTLSGELRLTDEDGDLVVETLVADALMGSWDGIGADPGDPLTGVAAGANAAE